MPSTTRKPTSGRGAIWEVLEDLLDFLQACEPGPAQIRRVLHDLRVSLDADVTFFFPGLSGDSFEYDGSPALSRDWCQRFTFHTLGSSPGIDDELVRSCLPPLHDGETELAPQSVAMVRLSRTYSTWLVALSFRPARLFRPTDMRILSLFRKILLGHRRQSRARDQWHSTLLGLIHCLVNSVEAKDPHDAGHSERVARLAVRLGQELHLAGAELSDLYLAGLVHDIGKIGLRDDILQKVGALTDAERDHLREHPDLGDRILARIPSLGHLRPAVRHHHERYDGGGYPDGLAGVAIPLLARVLAVADACDAMMSERPFRPALTPEQILADISSGAGSQWDPDVVRAFQTCCIDLFGIYQRGLSDSVVRALTRRIVPSTAETTHD